MGANSCFTIVWWTPPWEMKNDVDVQIEDWDQDVSCSWKGSLERKNWWEAKYCKREKGQRIKEDQPNNAEAKNKGAQRIQVEKKQFDVKKLAKLLKHKKRENIKTEHEELLDDKLIFSDRLAKSVS